jgi:hypothetical protein
VDRPHSIRDSHGLHVSILANSLESATAEWIGARSPRTIERITGAMSAAITGLDCRYFGSPSASASEFLSV